MITGAGRTLIGGTLANRTDSDPKLSPFCSANAQVVELADTGDLKSPGQMRLCGFKSRPGHCILRETERSSYV